MAQSAINSASSRTRCIDAMVASMLTTTPFLSPRDGCVPRPMMLSRCSGVTSATIATIFDVPEPDRQCGSAGGHSPRAARRKADLRDRQLGGPEHLAEFAETCGDVR